MDFDYDYDKATLIATPRDNKTTVHELNTEILLWLFKNNIHILELKISSSLNQSYMEHINLLRNE
ncbi:MAG: hypothetical protein ACD_79C00945G0006 [uncultured bacterium]|nr:MAG: hypothetical protein ACD_79C00945G0006 [uncultured bacterium]